MASKWAIKHAEQVIDLCFTSHCHVLKVAEALDAAAEEERERAIRAAYRFAHEFSINVTEDLFVADVLDKLGR